ncbi:MAG TPA: carbohydrate ABC transporter permease [Clostridiales bacterium]|nr:carbohydrate ABC transporter permease [Clostridiales bacterium]
MKRTKGEKIFEIFDMIILLIIISTIILPIMHIISVSISNKEAVLNLSIGIFPKGFTIEAYKDVISRKTFLSSLCNSIYLTILYTFFSLLVNTMCAYAFTKYFYGKKYLNIFFIITMYFSGGLIPTYILITNYLKMHNTFWAMLLPGIVNVFYMIIMRAQIEAIPKELSEAAIVDGAKEYQVLYKVILPAIKPTIAAVGMFFALDMWNMWFSCMLYTNKESMWTLQYFLRMMVFNKDLNVDRSSKIAISIDRNNIAPANFQMAAIVLVALPIVSIYPFIQKYFVKGILVGSVKG